MRKKTRTRRVKKLTRRQCAALGGRVAGGFDLSTRQAVAYCCVPIRK